MRGILDTSVVVAAGVAGLPDEAAISSATLAELHFGVHRARTEDERRRRVRRLAEIESSFAALPIDARVARAYGALAQIVTQAGAAPRRRVMDLLIGATAHVHGVPLFTRDEGMRVLASEVEVRVV
jgi:predicted nucleic acid-binding protein